MGRQETLCWRCKRPGTNTCSWDKSRGTIPVDGWDAEETKLWNAKEHAGHIITSYIVHECPLFKPEEDYDHRMTHSVGLGAENEKRATAGRDRIYQLFRYGFNAKGVALDCGISLETAKRYRREYNKMMKERND